MRYGPGSPRLLIRPRIYDFLHNRLEVAFVARDKRKSAHVRRGGDEGVHDADRSSRGLALRDHLAPTIGHRLVDREKARSILNGLLEQVGARGLFSRIPRAHRVSDRDLTQRKQDMAKAIEELENHKREG